VVDGNVRVVTTREAYKESEFFGYRQPTQLLEEGEHVSYLFLVTFIQGVDVA
jgi:hypothetical protein